MAKTILVTSATGNIGNLVVPELLKQGANVKAFVRNLHKAEHLEQAGAQLVKGDFNSPGSLNSAVRGVDAILAIVPPNELAVSQVTNILDAARLSGHSPYVLRISAIKAGPDAPTENGKMHFESDEELINSGLDYTILKPHFFMQNLFISIQDIMKDGSMYWGMGDGKLGLIDVRDIADCCVKILMEGGHNKKVYSPTGPESISFSDMANIIGNALNKTVNYVSVPTGSVKRSIREMGMGEWLADLLVDYSQAYSEGWGDFVTNDVELITGQKARSFSQFVEEVMVHGFKQPI